MGFLTWDPAYSVNVIEIDLQHKKLVAMINDLHDAMSSGKGRDVMGTLLRGLAQYAVLHFKTEETLMTRSNYPQIAAHKDEHAKFVAKVSSFESDFTSGKVTITLQVMNFLKEWLSSHILGTDQKYAPHFSQSGIR